MVVLEDSISENKELFANIGVSIEKKHVKGGCLLYACYLQILYLQIKIICRCWCSNRRK